MSTSKDEIRKGLPTYALENVEFMRWFEDKFMKYGGKPDADDLRALAESIQSLNDKSTSEYIKDLEDLQFRVDALKNDVGFTSELTLRLSEQATIKKTNNTWALYIKGELHNPLNALEERLATELLKLRIKLKEL